MCVPGALPPRIPPQLRAAQPHYVQNCIYGCQGAHRKARSAPPERARPPSLETSPSQCSCRRRPRAPFTFSRPSTPEGRRCRHRRCALPPTPPAPPGYQPRPLGPALPNSFCLRLALARGSSGSPIPLAGPSCQSYDCPPLPPPP